MKTIVLKCGGSVLDELSPAFFDGLRSLMEDGYMPVLVHGGGPAINSMLSLYQIPSKFQNGLRVTCEKTMEVVEMVLSGQTNRQLVRLFEHHDLTAVGLNGSDGKCLQAEYINKEELGFVGQITAVNKKMIEKLLVDRIIPVITPIAASMEETGARMNVNADYAAAAVAKALNAERCLFVTNVDGILVEGQLVEEATESDIQSFISDGHIYGGMIPKVESALSVLGNGIEKVMIVSGKKSFYQSGIWTGTAITSKERVF
ncbi:acetylglutamate kinase [Mesobacillus foraminis]|uniref:acetylglutamate kinase n=1 Tax=Mesobacillus foraminis TaxID=279826 RepID=UPI000EF516A7|nr:acetylglutamate kinase [Mesobacillus foraminis]